MSDLFKSAFGYLNPNGTQVDDNEFVGQIVEIGSVKLTVKRVIAEGGFAFVYAVQDPHTGKEYALKRLIASDKDTNALILSEINTLKLLSGHPNIIQYMAAAALDRAGTGTEYLLLTELCPRGLVDCLGGAMPSPLPPDAVAKVIWQTCKAVHHMHSQTPPIVHRDLKLENLLISNDGVIKLCDFGSCTVNAVNVNESWSASQRAALEDQMAQCTTPMYRAPEMVDTWSNHAIGKPADIWAIGCLIYTLCYANHPFSDSAKLKILNANFTLPPADTKYSAFHDVIRGCLIADPAKRLTVNELLDRLSAVNETKGYDMRTPLQLASKPKPPQESQPCRPPSSPTRPPPPSPSRPPAPSVNSQAPTRPLPPAPRKVDETPQQAGLFSSIKGGAGSFLKNLKSTSSKVISTVQQSIARSELDMSYITSRIIVMPFPADGIELATMTGCKVNHVEDVREFVETRYPSGRYCVYNLSGRAYPPSRLGHGKVVDLPFGGFRRVPPLHIIYRACSDIMAYLERDSKHAILIHGIDGKAAPAVLVTSLLLYARVLPRWQDALQMFAVKRAPPDLQPSEQKYLEYMTSILGMKPDLPHILPVTIATVTLSPVPLFTKLRDGCRPYLEIYQGDEKVKSTLIDYERMRVYHVSEGKVTLTANVTVIGDVTVGVYHARQNLGGVMTSGRSTGHRIAQFQFHTGFLSQSRTTLVFNRCDLDEPAEGDHYLDGFRVEVQTVWGSQGQPYPTPWDAPRHVDPQHLFANTLEMEETIDNFESKPVPPPKNADMSASTAPLRPPRPAAPASVFSEPPVSVTPAVESLTPAQQVNQPQRIRQESVDLLGLGFDEVRSQPISNSTTEPKPMSDLDSLFGTTSTDAHNSVPYAFNAAAGVQPSRPAAFSTSTFSPSSTASSFATPASQQSQFAAPPAAFGAPSNIFGVPPVSKTSPSQPQTSGFDGLMFDPFDSVTHNKPAEKVQSVPRNSSATNLDQRSKDPFADLGNLGVNLNIPSRTPTASKPGSPMNGTPAGSPSMQSPMHRPGKTSNETSANMARSPMNPDYSRSHFDTMSKKPMEASKPADIFGDLLGSQGYEFLAKKDAGPRTMNQLRKEDMVKEMDPERIKIIEWTEGKKGNIRALLCSMHSLLWENCKWKGIDMSQLVTAADVKKAYRRACLAVHPDKQVGTENENIAKLIFIELNNAWTDFENDSTQQNLFST